MTYVTHLDIVYGTIIELLNEEMTMISI